MQFFVYHDFSLINHFILNFFDSCFPLSPPSSNPSSVIGLNCLLKYTQMVIKSPHHICWRRFLQTNLKENFVQLFLACFFFFFFSLYVCIIYYFLIFTTGSILLAIIWLAVKGWLFDNALWFYQCKWNGLFNRPNVISFDTKYYFHDQFSYPLIYVAN